MSELREPILDHEQPLGAPVFFKMLGHLAVHAYDNLPLVRRGRPMPLFAAMEHQLIDSPQPLQPAIPTVAQRTRDIITDRAVAAPTPLSLSDKLTRSARMIQFTDRLMSRDHAFFEYARMKGLKDYFVAAAKEQAYPLSFDQQLEIALELAGNDLNGALTNLWLTSRQYARWLDSVSIRGLPDLTPEEILTDMQEWRGSILACKNGDEENFQDTAGDAYYAWTHARAGVIHGSGTGIASRIGAFIFSHGTTVNSHRFIPRTIPSDHRKAAAYGNAIADAILSTTAPH